MEESGVCANHPKPFHPQPNSLVPSDWKLKSSPIPQPPNPPFLTSLPHASLFLSLHRRLLAKAQATVPEVKLCLASFLPHSFLASPPPVISAIVLNDQSEREVKTHRLVTTEMYRSDLYDRHHSNSHWAMLTTRKLPLVWSVQAETVIQKEHWLWFKKRLLLNRKMATRIM